MGTLPANAAAIIREAAKSPLGIVALMVLALGVLASIFFRQASERARVGIFALLVLGVAGFAVAAMRATNEATRLAAGVRPIAQFVVRGFVTDRQTRQTLEGVKILAAGTPLEITSGDDGRILGTLRDVPPGAILEFTAHKPGYLTWRKQYLVSSGTEGAEIEVEMERDAH
ncbi:MAG TPA: hypothetical protein VMS93_04660 [Candidatus Saccharimonadales bacterium]|nr:hypothetical protein [Candidatus Saccharimonadales bacterium]